MSTENSQRESAGAVALLTENWRVLREISWELNALGWSLPGMAPVDGDTDNTPFRVRAVAARWCSCRRSSCRRWTGRGNLCAMRQGRRCWLKGAMMRSLTWLDAKASNLPGTFPADMTNWPACAGRMTWR